MDRKKQRVWIWGMVCAVLMALPIWMFLQAGRQIDLNQNLFQAIRRNDANTVQFLLDAGAEANAREPRHDTRSMLQQISDRLRGMPAPAGPAALLIHLERVPNKTISDSWTTPPENIAIVRALLDHHADPNVRGEDERTPLMMAVLQRKESTIQLLITRGADVNAKDSQGETALAHAIGIRAASIALLKAAGAR